MPKNQYPKRKTTIKLKPRSNLKKMMRSVFAYPKIQVDQIRDKGGEAQ